MKLSGWTTKRVLREAMRGILPDAILTARRWDFPCRSRVDATGWNQVARDVLLDRRSCERGLIDPAAVDRLLRSHPAGAADDGDGSGPDEPRALVPHVHRRGRRSDAAGTHAAPRCFKQSIATLYRVYRSRIPRRHLIRRGGHSA